MIPIRALGVGLAVGTITTPCAAQVALSLDGAATRVAYTDVPAASAFTVTPMLQVTRPLVSLFAVGSFSQVDGSGWSLQGTTSGSVFTPGGAGIRLEVGGLASGSTHGDGNGSAALSGRARLHWVGSRAGVWAGGGLGGAWNSLQWRTTREASGGAWLRAAPLTLIASATPTWIGDSLRFIDTEGTVRLVRGAVELAAFGGLRHWSRPSGVGSDAWAGVSGVVWLGPNVGIVGGGGAYPTDYGQGLPGGSYVTLGIRVATRRPAEAERAREPFRRPELTLPRRVVPAFEVRPLGDGRRMVRIEAPAARRVEVMGDFTEWKPVALRRGSGSAWTVALPIRPGTYRMNIRIDGGTWSVPPGVTALQDDFGGSVGILRVE
ncbi:MAG TPA: glycogen-binding domain-containing protein [Gemmatimonadales bacterium]|nr:glycogen-binding domain-containing protein [Gemmatimonadales bacterium]